MQEKNQDHFSKPNPKPENKLLRFSGIAFEVSVFNIVCIWGGYELSVRFTPQYHALLIISVFLATAGTIYYLYKQMNQP